MTAFLILFLSVLVFSAVAVWTALYVAIRIGLFPGVTLPRLRVTYSRFEINSYHIPMMLTRSLNPCVISEKLLAWWPKKMACP